MSKEEVRKSFKAENQALLFAWIAKSAIEKMGKAQAEPVLKKAVIRYGEQRGKRMALRAAANRHPLDMLGYLSYGEWKAGKGEMQMIIIKQPPDLCVKAPKCSWYTAWSNAGLNEFGKYYCQSIDVAVMHGYNPALRLDVMDIKPEGKPECVMLFHDARLGPAEMLALMGRKMFKPGRKAVMPWDYHTGHIYKTMKEVLTQELGAAGNEIIKLAMAEFSKRYGAEAAQLVEEFDGVGFDTLPAGK